MRRPALRGARCRRGGGNLRTRQLSDDSAASAWVTSAAATAGCGTEAEASCSATSPTCNAETIIIHCYLLSSIIIINFIIIHYYYELSSIIIYHLDQPHLEWRENHLSSIIIYYGSKPTCVPGCRGWGGGGWVILCTGGLDVIRKEAWSFYRTSSGVRLCWELEEPKGPNGPKGPKGWHLGKLAVGGVLHCEHQRQRRRKHPAHLDGG